MGSNTKRVRMTFDFETTNLDYGDATNRNNRIVMVAWKMSDEERPRYYYGPITDAGAFWRDLDRATDLCAYHAKFEQKWLIRLGIDIHKWRWHDPMLLEKIRIANRQLGLSLDAVAKRYGLDAKDPLIDKLMKAGMCPSQMPRDRLIARCVRDVRTTEELHDCLTYRIGADGQTHLARNRCDFQPILAEMEMNGMQLDSERVQQEYEKAVTANAKLRAELDSVTGGINLKSPDQMAHYLYGTLGFPERQNFAGKVMRNKPSKQFPDGRPKTDKDTLAWLATLPNLTSKQKEFLDLRKRFGKVDAALTKNLKFFKGICDERDGNFYGTFNQTVAATDRLTSSGMRVTFSNGESASVQFQNMPRAFKRVFCAPPGYYVVEADAPQLEFRGAALVAQDAQAMADILDPDFDAHCRSASVMNEIAYDQFLKRFREGNAVYKGMRQNAKPDTFKPLYGGTKGTPEQERWYAEFQERYAGVTQVQGDWLTSVQQHGKLTLPWGKTFYWETYTKRNGVTMDKRRGKPVAPQVANYPIQNLATAEIVPLSIIYLHRRCRALGIEAIFVNTVHDSVIAYVPKDQIDDFNEQCRLAFTKDVYKHLDEHYGIECNVPLGVEIVYGDHWGEGESVIFDDVTDWRLK